MLPPLHARSTRLAEIVAVVSQPTLLRARIAQLSNGEIRSLILRAEARHEGSFAPHWAARLSVLSEGQAAKVPLAMLRPGQVQLSLDHVRDKMLRLVGRLEKSSAGERSLIREDELTVAVAAGGRTLLLSDGHHKAAAMKALLGLVGTGPSPLVPVTVKTNLRHSSDAEAAARLGRPHQMVSLRMRSGAIAREIPEGFSELEDNPYRHLASRLGAKARRSGPGKRTVSIKGAARPLFVKGPAAPDFVEFAIARIFERALPGWRGPKISGRDRETLRRALLAARESGAQPELESLLLVPLGLGLDELRARLRIGRKRGKLKLRDA
jgi:hypothetical protein